MIRGIEIYVYDENDPEAIRQDSAQLDRLEDGTYSANVFTKSWDDSWLGRAVSLKRERAAHLLLDEMHVPPNASLKNRIALAQLMDFE